MTSCLLHRIHRPANLTVELHHVIPRAWQFSIGPLLFDKRTVALCPTSHRNVHFWIVALMRAAAKAQSDDPLVAYKAVRPKWPPKEFAIAYDALTRWRAPGRTLAQLYEAGEWGQI